MSRPRLVPDRVLLRRAIRQGSGFVATTARAYGVARNTVYRWLDDDEELRELAEKLRKGGGWKWGRPYPKAANE